MPKKPDKNRSQAPSDTPAKMDSRSDQDRFPDAEKEPMEALKRANALLGESPRGDDHYPGDVNKERIHFDKVDKNLSHKV